MMSRKLIVLLTMGFAALLHGSSPALAQESLGAAEHFAVLSAAPAKGGMVTCTNSTIAGDVGSSGIPASVVQTECTVTGAIIAPVSPHVIADFNDAYSSYTSVECTGTLATAYTNTALTLTPGVYCNIADVTFTNTTLTLDGEGDANAAWIFKIGTGGTGALTGTDFTVIMARGGQACNVTWWVAEAATMTTSDFKGTILAGAAITSTGTAGTPAPFEGRALAKAAVTLTDVALVGCEGGTSGPPNPPRERCNQGVGNGPEDCDPGRSNQGDPDNSNDENGGTPGKPGKKGGKG